jgi:hypothetical protein
MFEVIRPGDHFMSAANLELRNEVPCVPEVLMIGQAARGLDAPA